MTTENYVNVYGLMGLPGAGKTTAAMILAGETDSAILRAGKAIRTMLKEQRGVSDPTSEALGEFAAQKRQEEGPGFFGTYAKEQVTTLQPGTDESLVIDSFRHREGVRQVEEMLEVDFTSIMVECPRAVRLKRMQRRGRDDEADFTMKDLEDRDMRELIDLGVDTLIDYDEDYLIRNNKGKRHLYDRVMDIIND